MKSKGLTKVYSLYTRSGILEKGITMDEVLDRIKRHDIHKESTRDHNSKTEARTWKSTMKV